MRSNEERPLYSEDGKSSRSAFSEDGRGTEPVSAIHSRRLLICFLKRLDRHHNWELGFVTVQLSTIQVHAHHWSQSTHAVYYRLYTKGGPLESINPIYSDDGFISRILSTSVRPPHTVTSIKRYLCKIEDLASEKCTLYQSLSGKTALEDSTRLSLRGTPGPGSSVDDPMALVSINERQSQVERSAASQELLERDFEQRYGTTHSLHLT